MKRWIMTVGAIGLTTQIQAATDTQAPLVKASIPNRTYAAAQNVILCITDNSDTSPKL